MIASLYSGALTTNMLKGNGQIYKSSVEKSKYLKLVQPLNTHLHCISLEIYIFLIPLQSSTLPITQPLFHEGQTTQWLKEKNMQSRQWSL